MQATTQPQGLTGTMLKLSCGEDLRRMLLTPGMSFVELSDKISSAYNLTDEKYGFVIKYSDVDGDLVSVTGDEELRIALALTTPPHRFEVFRCPKSPGGRGKPRPAVVPQPKATLQDSLVDFLRSRGVAIEDLQHDAPGLVKHFNKVAAKFEQHLAAPPPAAQGQKAAKPEDTGSNLTSEQRAIVEAAKAAKQHLGIWCDVTGASPIVGTRYTKQLRNDTYDLCEDAFKTLSPEEQAGFVAVEVPDVKLLVKTVSASAVGSDYLLPEMTEAVPEAPAAERSGGSVDLEVKAHRELMGAMQTKQRCVDALSLTGMTSQQVGSVITAVEAKEHLSIWCDLTKQNPIIGTRYTKQLRGDTYDLCEDAFKTLSPEEQAGFVAVDVPDIKLLVKSLLREHVGKKALNRHAIQAEKVQAALEFEKTGDVGAVAGTVLNSALARGFVSALRAEYLEGVEQGVGKFFEEVEPAEPAGAVMDVLEEMVRRATMKAETIKMVAVKLGLDALAAEPGKAAAAKLAGKSAAVAAKDRALKAQGITLPRPKAPPKAQPKAPPKAPTAAAMELEMHLHEIPCRNEYEISMATMAGTVLSFAYDGGANPGTRRTAVFIQHETLNGGAAGFRAEHDGKPKKYNLAKCSGMQSACTSDSDGAAATAQLFATGDATGVMEHVKPELLLGTPVGDTAFAETEFSEFVEVECAVEPTQAAAVAACAAALPAPLATLASMGFDVTSARVLDAIIASDGDMQAAVLSLIQEGSA